MNHYLAAHEIIDDSDMIILHNPESYLRSINYNLPTNDQLSRTRAIEEARNVLYSQIIMRLPKVAKVLMSQYSLNLEDGNERFAALFGALSKHCLDPYFVGMAMQRIQQLNDPGIQKTIGALFSKIMHRYCTENIKVTKSVASDKDKKGVKAEETATVTNAAEVAKSVEHLRDAIRVLLGNVASMFMTGTRFGNITDFDQAIGLASVVVMHNKDSIMSILDMNAAVTAGLFECLDNDGQGQIIATALLLEKADFVKLSTNGSAFMESLKRWVFEKLNALSPFELNKFLLSVYNSLKPDTNKYFIQIKDCGTQYSNLLIVAKQIIN